MNNLAKSTSTLMAAIFFLTCSTHDRSNPIDPDGSNWNPPIIGVMNDTTVAFNDSFYIHADIASQGVSIKCYIWEFPNARDSTQIHYFRDTTSEGRIKVAYSSPGTYLIGVWAMGDNGFLSGWQKNEKYYPGDTLGQYFNSPEYIVVDVHQYAPSVGSAITNDSSVNINDSIVIRVYKATDTNGVVTKYLWARTGANYTDTTVEGMFKTAWPDSGKKIVLVKVVDDDGLISKPETCVVRVMLDPPVVVAMRDTLVSFARTDSLRLIASASDTNGAIVRYLWDIGADGIWEDSTITGDKTIKSVDGGPVSVRWAACDNDGVLTLDTFLIIFKRPPSNPVVIASKTWKIYISATGRGTLPLALSATDPDGATNTLRYILSTGTFPGTFTHQYAGNATVFDLANVDSSSAVYWRLDVRDKFGDSAIANGVFVSPSPPPPGMKLITAGIFQMGSMVNTNEQPLHDVTVSSFYMDSTEVIQTDYLALMGVNPADHSSVTNGPVENVTWFDAVLYCNKRSKRDGKDTVYSYTTVTGTQGNGCTALGGVAIAMTANGYRLPTEAEWEYACRAGTTTDYYWGESTIGNYEWYYSNSGTTTSHTVALKLPNAYGLYDMAGNVNEWNNDWFGNFTAGVTTDPTGVAIGLKRVVRGNSYCSDAPNSRSSYRYSQYPSSRFFATGFRVVLPVR